MSLKDISWVECSVVNFIVGSTWFMNFYFETILNFEFCLSLQFVSGSLHFPLLRTYALSFFTQKSFKYNILFHKFSKSFVNIYKKRKSN